MLPALHSGIKRHKLSTPRRARLTRLSGIKCVTPNAAATRQQDNRRYGFAKPSEPSPRGGLDHPCRAGNLNRDSTTAVLVHIAEFPLSPLSLSGDRSPSSKGETFAERGFLILGGENHG